MDLDSKRKIRPLEKIVSSIDNILMESREQKLKEKLGKKIKNSIFTEDILSKLNECDFTNMTDESCDMTRLFESIFPIFIKDGNTTFRLYKHKIEVDLSDEMKDRYIYIFSDGRFTSGLFQCFNISDDEYVYGIKKIVDVIPKIRREIFITLENFKDNLDKQKTRIDNLQNKEKKAEENYKELNLYVDEAIKNISVNEGNRNA